MHCCEGASDVETVVFRQTVTVNIVIVTLEKYRRGPVILKSDGMRPVVENHFYILIF